MRLPSAGVDGPRCSCNPEVKLVRQPPRAAGLPPSSRIPETMAGKLRIYADIRTLPQHENYFAACYQPKIQANMSGATIVASDSIIYLGVSRDSLPQVIFSFGTAPE